MPTVPHTITKARLTSPESPDSPILVQEERAIARLARDTHTAIAKVQEVFLAEYEKLAPSARIKAFLPLLTGKRVRALLRKATDR
jgi:hypothetical protein